MGGHRAGDVASRETVDGLCGALCCGWRTPDDIVKAVEAVNRRIFNASAANGELSGMGTTVVAGYLSGDKLRIANVGDSRCYMIRDNAITQITVDHSYIEEHIAAGNITREQAADHPQRHMITRAIGTEVSVEVDMFEVDVRQGDVFLFCTDGLTEMVSDDALLSAVTVGANMEEAVTGLVSAANDNGGVDNITVVAMKFEQGVRK